MSQVRNLSRPPETDEARSYSPSGAPSAVDSSSSGHRGGHARLAQRRRRGGGSAGRAGLTMALTAKVPPALLTDRRADMLDLKTSWDHHRELERRSYVCGHCGKDAGTREGYFGTLAGQPI